MSSADSKSTPCHFVFTSFLIVNKYYPPTLLHIFFCCLSNNSLTPLYHQYLPTRHAVHPLPADPSFPVPNVHMSLTKPPARLPPENESVLFGFSSLMMSHNSTTLSVSLLGGLRSDRVSSCRTTAPFLRRVSISLPVATCSMYDSVGQTTTLCLSLTIALNGRHTSPSNHFMLHLLPLRIICNVGSPSTLIALPLAAPKFTNVLRMCFPTESGGPCFAANVCLFLHVRLLYL